jgi:hypothetical protein
MEQLQILFRYNSVIGILTLFIKQLESVPEIQKSKVFLISTQDVIFVQEQTGIAIKDQFS